MQFFRMLILNYKDVRCPAKVGICRWFPGWPELDVKAAHVKCALMRLASELERAAIMADPEVKKAALCMHALAMFCVF